MSIFSPKPLSELTVNELEKKGQFFNTTGKVSTIIMIIATVSTLIRIYLKVSLPYDSIPILASVFLGALVAKRQKEVTTEIDARIKSEVIRK
ncbi:hypothetical protein M0L20_29395 [Spirosoma sp. RP8]|uniref:Uncharacterized protein n=1 Tax=Spirosoma liriopis TaxID=2937440 RepID=A0ABT0HV84_9BACT|nr:hypothetical protein [Spirosoma liriopis]MCK8496017.1 hypothetical protein [Spirosoma liriopis]